jgi:ribosomal protein L24
MEGKKKGQEGRKERRKEKREKVRIEQFNLIASSEDLSNCLLSES